MDNPCKQLEHLPVVGENQLEVLCPNCKHYHRGQCVNPSRTTTNDPCPFDDKPLPTKIVEVDQ